MPPHWPYSIIYIYIFFFWKTVLERPTITFPAPDNCTPLHYLWTGLIQGSLRAFFPLSTREHTSTMRCCYSACRLHLWHVVLCVLTISSQIGFRFPFNWEASVWPEMHTVPVCMHVYRIFLYLFFYLKIWGTVRFLDCIDHSSPIMMLCVF